VEDSVLNVLRRHASSWWLKGILIAVALSFIIGFGILNRVSSADRSRYVIKVGNAIVSPSEFSDLMSQGEQEYYQKNNVEMTDNDRINLQTSIINNRIDQMLENKEADRLGLVVSDTEVAEYIAQEPVFQKDGSFDYDTFKQYIDYEGYSEKMFEENVRQSLLVQKLKDVVTDSVKVSDDEILETANSQGRTVTRLDELSPDEKEYFGRLALAIKRFAVYREFLGTLKDQEKVDINREYLYTKESPTE
jgi:peptidyl-prolyl cis-trans isomerase D